MAFSAGSLALSCTVTPSCFPDKPELRPAWKKTAADWWRRTQLLLGSEKDTGRTLQGTDWLSEAPTGPQTPLLVLVLRSAVLEMAAAAVAAVVDVVAFLLNLATVVLLKMEPLVLVLVAVVGMLLGVMGSPK